ncbi:MAG: hypothetical protein P8106_05450, partial [Gammaproteobacteria bacterium]
MKLVEGHQTDAGQLRITLQAAGQHALRDDLDAGARADALLEADPVAHAFANGLAEAFRHEGRGEAGRGTARLEQQDATARQPAFV